MDGQELSFRKMEIKTATVLLLTLLVLVGAGCAVDKEPFNDFSTAVTNTQSGIENCINLTYDFAKNDFAESFVSDDKAKFSSLQLATLKADKTILGYGGISDKQPLFASIIQARTALLKLNTAFSSYASLLQTLAGTKSLSSAELNELSANVNATATAVWELSGEKPPTGAGELVGSAFAMSADLYVKNKIKSYLRNAITGNQPQVELYAKQGAKLVLLLRLTLKQSYDKQFEHLHVKWKESKTAEERKQLLTTTLALNTKLVSVFELLSALDKAYALIPKANCDLATSLDEENAALPWLNRLARLSADLKILNSNLTTLTAQK